MARPSTCCLPPPLPQILLRKGGIREPTFRPASGAFFLFPTAFHTDAELLKPAARNRSVISDAYVGQQATCSLLPLLDLPLLLPPPPPSLQLTSQHGPPFPLACRYAAEVAFDPRSQPSLDFSCWAEVTGAWATHDTDGAAACSEAAVLLVHALQGCCVVGAASAPAAAAAVAAAPRTAHLSLTTCADQWSEAA